MVAQVIAAPVIVVGKVATAVAKTAATVVSKVGAASARAGMSAARAVGSSARAGLSSAASSTGRGLLSSVRSGPAAGRFASLSNARSAVARMPSPARAQTAARSPVGRSIQRAASRGAARERVGVEPRAHAVDARDRAVSGMVRRAQGEGRSGEEGVIGRMARSAMERMSQERSRKPLSAEMLRHLTQERDRSGVDPASDD